MATPISLLLAWHAKGLQRLAPPSKSFDRMRERNVKLAYLVNTYPRGSTTFIRRELQALERQGLPVHRFAMRPEDKPYLDPGDIAEESRTEYVLRAGATKLFGTAAKWMFRRPLASLRALRLAMRCGREGMGSTPGTGGRIKHLIYLLEAAYIASRCHDLRITHVHAHFGTNSATVAMLAAELGGAAYSFTVHGPEEFDAPRALCLGEKADRALFTVAISSFGRGQLRRWTKPETWKRLFVVHCGIETWRFNDPAKMPADGRKLVAIGRFSEQKGFDLLIEAMAEAVKAAPELTLTMVGDGELRPRIEQAIARHNLSAHVTLAGWQDESRVRAALADAHALVVPSFAEGLPVVIMEAMAAARPVIATAIAGVPELVTPDCGWLVPSGDPVALARGLQAMAATPLDDLSQMGKSARARVFDRHDITKEAEKLAVFFASRGNP